MTNESAHLQRLLSFRCGLFKSPFSGVPKALISGWVYASGIIISEPFLCSSQVSEKNEISGLGQGGSSDIFLYCASSVSDGGR